MDLNPDAELTEILYPNGIAEITMPAAFIIEKENFSSYIADSTQQFPVTPY